MADFVNRDMADNGRRLEMQVADVMQLLAGIQSDLAEITNSPAAARARARALPTKSSADRNDWQDGARASRA